MEWVKWLKIPDFKGIFSRDDVGLYSTKSGCCIINLDDKIGNGTHWVAKAIAKDKKLIYYFDSFCLPPPQEFVDYANRLGIEYQYNIGYPFQEMKSVRCGYYCLYFLDNIYKKSFYDCISKFEIDNQKYNEKFIKKYFS